MEDHIETTTNTGQQKMVSNPEYEHYRDKANISFETKTPESNSDSDGPQDVEKSKDSPTETTHTTPEPIVETHQQQTHGTKQTPTQQDPLGRPIELRKSTLSSELRKQLTLGAPQTVADKEELHEKTDSLLASVHQISQEIADLRRQAGLQTSQLRQNRLYLPDFIQTSYQNTIRQLLTQELLEYIQFNLIDPKTIIPVTLTGPDNLAPLQYPRESPAWTVFAQTPTVITARSQTVIATGFKINLPDQHHLQIMPIDKLYHTHKILPTNTLITPDNKEEIKITFHSASNKNYIFQKAEPMVKFIISRANYTQLKIIKE